MIPVVDLKDPSSHEMIREACLQHGFFYVKAPYPGYFDMHDKVAEYFARPLDEKMQQHIKNNLPQHVGYVPIDEENLHGETLDFKECFDYEVNMFGDTHYALVRELAFFERYHLSTKFIGVEIMDRICQSLDLPRKHWRGMFNEGRGYARMIHYPANSQGVGCGEHTDYGFITILNQDQVGGLQIQFNDEWVDAEPIPDTVVVNIGDLLSLWTNGLYKSTVHRVKHTKNVSRYSVPFFFNPDPYAKVFPMVDKGDICKYNAVMSGKYIQGRYDDTFGSRKGSNKPDQMVTD